MAQKLEADSNRPKRRQLLEKLLAALASAESGSRQLDLVISYVMDQNGDETGEMIRLLVQEGYAWDAVEGLLREDVPFFTSSLDHPIPDENIVLSLFSPKRKRWIALHKDPDDSLIRGTGETECLARRAAALKAHLKAASDEVSRDEPAPAEETLSPDSGAIEEDGNAELDELLLKRILARSAPELQPQPGSAETNVKAEDKEDWKVLF
jgi:hypothetical protein